MVFQVSGNQLYKQGIFYVAIRRGGQVVSIRHGGQVVVQTNFSKGAQFCIFAFMILY
jgi:hypothetical protein